MAKKRVLFVNYSLHSGGIEKSLVTLLNLFDYEKYEVDLQLFVNEGLFLPMVPKEVNLLPPFFPEPFGYPIQKGFLSLVLHGKWKAAITRLKVSLLVRGGTMGQRLLKLYELEKPCLTPPKQHYDAAVAFMEGQPLYYVADIADCPNKIGFIHGDYEAMDLDAEGERPYLDRLDALCTVSEGCKAALDRVFPEQKAKHHLIYNILSADMLEKLARQEGGFDDGFKGRKILTIARLSPQKGLDMGMQAISLLKNQGIDFRWYIIGKGPEYQKLKGLMEEKGLQGRVVFLGERSNPYPYFKQCDLYFQPSRFEGKAIAVDEAIFFRKPILLANFSTARDQISHEENGLIADFTPEALATGLSRLLTDQPLCTIFCEELGKVKTTNEEEIQKLYQLIDNGGQN